MLGLRLWVTIPHLGSRFDAVNGSSAYIIELEALCAALYPESILSHRPSVYLCRQRERTLTHNVKQFESNFDYGFFDR